ncbi:MAG: VOC family protein [Caulobacteraceae bacterium]
MLPITALHHLSFRVPDLGEAMRFYCDILGFSPIERPDIGVPGAWLAGYGLEVHLLAPPGAEPAGGALNPTRNHVAFKVSDLPVVRARLGEAHLDILEGDRVGHQLWVLDPGRNVIEFIAA